MSVEHESDDRAAIAAAVRAWYGRYLAVFMALARGERDDVAALLDFYAAPLVLATEGRVTIMPTAEAVLELAQSLIVQLRQADYAGSETHRLEARPLHARAAWIEGTFSRRNRAGAIFERFGVAYLVVRPEDGWRIAAIVPIPA